MDTPGVDKLKIPSPLQELDLRPLNHQRPSFFIKRDDLIHPKFGGNKYRKLIGFIEAYRDSGCQSIMTVGGAWSNHLYSTAFLCKHLGIPCYGLVKYHNIDDGNATLETCRKAKMRLISVKRNISSTDIDELTKKHDSFFIPEGGAGVQAYVGVEQMLKEILDVMQPSHIIVSVGMGATLAGILRAKPKEVRVIAISSFPQEDFERRWPLVSIEDVVWKDVSQRLGRFGAFNPEIITINGLFLNEYGFPLDPIYTSKSMITVMGMIGQSYFNADDRIVFIHTGGLQGWEGYNSRYSAKIDAL